MQKTDKNSFSFIVLVLISLSTLISSCAFHSGTTSGGSGVVTNHQYHSIDYAVGTAKTTHFMLIGGNQKDGLVLEAKRNLLTNYSLKPTQVLGQTTIDFKRTLFFPILTTKVTITSEVIDFSPEPLDSAEVLRNQQAFTHSPGFQNAIQDSMVTYSLRDHLYPARILAYQNGKYVIQYFNNHNAFKVKTVKASSIVKSKDFSSIQQKEEVYTTPENPEKELVKFLYRGKVLQGENMGPSGSFILVRMQNAKGELVGILIPKEDILKR